MFPAEKTHDSDSTPLEPPSKSARKRAMHDLQQLGIDLVALDPGRLSTLDLPERLRGRNCPRARHHQARGPAATTSVHWQVDARCRSGAAQDGVRRVGTLGRPIDRGRFAAAEQWRDRLLDDADGLTEFVAAHPAADRTRACGAGRRCARRTRPRIAAAQYRALFRELKRIIDELPGD